MKIVSVWSGPRNVSTALMYSFSQRKDTKVVDEPFYGYYLSNTHDAIHPGREEIIQCMETDHRRVIENILQSRSNEVLFIKNMAHHLIFDEPEFMLKMVNVFLIRDPREMLTSLMKNIPDATLRDTGLSTQLDLYKRIINSGGKTIILDSKEILINPDKVLRKFCDFLNIPFDPGMLQWEKGPIEEDGCWAEYWYHSVHNSTGFAPYKPKSETVPNDKQALLEECTKIYEELYTHAIKA